jgi:hypothetical protein
MKSSRIAGITTAGLYVHETIAVLEAAVTAQVAWSP